MSQATESPRTFHGLGPTRAVGALPLSLFGVVLACAMQDAGLDECSGPFQFYNLGVSAAKHLFRCSNLAFGACLRELRPTEQAAMHQRPKLTSNLQADLRAQEQEDAAQARPYRGDIASVQEKNVALGNNSFAC